VFKQCVGYRNNAGFHRKRNEKPINAKGDNRALFYIPYSQACNAYQENEGQGCVTIKKPSFKGI
jgi:hypothetical protein